MKKAFFLLTLLLFVIQTGRAQWTLNGNYLSNTNSGYVNITTSLLVGNTFTAAPGYPAGTVVFGPSRVTGVWIPPSVSAPWQNFIKIDQPNNQILISNGNSDSGGGFFRGYLNGETRIFSQTNSVSGNSYITFFTNNNESARFDFNGNLIIGSTTNPSGYKLAVNGGAMASSMTLKNTLSTGYSETLYAGTGASYRLGTGNASETSLGVANSWYVYDVNKNTVRMMINSNGNLLLGQTKQTNSNYLLDVNGSVRSKGIVVNTSGADFVFADDYQLQALSEVKKYIDSNKHLPGISSAKEMQENGLDLGKNQTQLLQKVEELTLYLIEKDQEEQRLKATIAKQALQMRAQEDRLLKLELALEKISVQKQ